MRRTVKRHRFGFYVTDECRFLLPQITGQNDTAISYAPRTCIVDINLPMPKLEL